MDSGGATSCDNSVTLFHQRWRTLTRSFLTDIKNKRITHSAECGAECPRKEKNVEAQVVNFRNYSICILGTTIVCNCLRFIQEQQTQIVLDMICIPSHWHTKWKFWVKKKEKEKYWAKLKTLAYKCNHNCPWHMAWDTWRTSDRHYNSLSLVPPSPPPSVDGAAHAN